MIPHAQSLSFHLDKIGRYMQFTFKVILAHQMKSAI